MGYSTLTSFSHSRRGVQSNIITAVYTSLIQYRWPTHWKVLWNIIKRNKIKTELQESSEEKEQLARFKEKLFLTRPRFQNLATPGTVQRILPLQWLSFKQEIFQKKKKKDRRRKSWDRSFFKGKNQCHKNRWAVAALVNNVFINVQEILAAGAPQIIMGILCSNRKLPSVHSESLLRRRPKDSTFSYAEKIVLSIYSRLFFILHQISFEKKKICNKCKVPISANWNDVCLQNTSKSHSYHLKIWYLLWFYG